MLNIFMYYSPPCVVQSVTSLTADPEVVSFISPWSHSFGEIGREIISTVILLLPLIQEGLLSVSRESTGKPLYQAYPGKKCG